MTAETKEPTTPVVVAKALRARNPARHRLEENPPPPIRAFSIEQIENEHPGVKGRIRTWIHRADGGDETFAWLKFCIIRVGRSVLIDETMFRESLYERTGIPASEPRRSGPMPKKSGGGRKAGSL